MRGGVEEHLPEAGDVSALSQWLWSLLSSLGGRREPSQLPPEAGADARIVSRVMAADAWPTLALTSFTLTPACSRCVMWVCRRSWKRRPWSSRRAFISRRKTCCSAFGERGRPGAKLLGSTARLFDVGVVSGNTRLLSSHPRSLSRSAFCLRRCSLRTWTVSGWSGTVRGLPGLGRLQPERRPNLLEGVAHDQRAGLQIDVGPLKGQQLAQAEARRHSDRNRRPQRPTRLLLLRVRIMKRLNELLRLRLRKHAELAGLVARQL